jgi:hypothetical protein
MLISLFFLTLFFASCTQTDLVTLDESGKNVNMAVTISTRSSSDPNVTASEDAVSEVYVLIYNSNYLLENGSDIFVTGTNLNSKRWVVKEGVKHVYVIVNPSSELKARLNSLPSHSNLLAMKTSVSSFETDVSNNPTTGMLMTGKSENQLIGETNNSVAVNLTKRMARVDLYMRKEANVTGAVTIKSVSMDNTRKVGQLFDDSNSYTDSNSYSVSGGLINSSGVLVSVTTSSPSTDTDYTLVSHNYTHPNILGTTFSESSVNKLNIILTYVEGGYTMTYTYIAYISDSNLYQNSKSLFSNNIYQVKTTLYKEGLNLGISGTTTVTNTFTIN